MGTTAKDTGGSEFTPCPEGTHVARCVQVIDLGTQYSKYYGKNKHKIIIGWEIPDIDKGEEGCQLVWCRYTLSLHRNAALRAHLESWRGRQFTAEELQGFDLQRILDVPCLISIAHRVNGQDTYADVKAVMKLPKGSVCGDRITEIVYFDVDNFDQDTFDTFSKNLKETIENSAERKAARGEYDTSDANETHASENAGHEEDIPF